MGRGISWDALAHILAVVSRIRRVAVPFVASMAAKVGRQELGQSIHAKEEQLRFDCHTLVLLTVVQF